MSDTGTTAAVVFVAVTSFALLVAAVVGGRKSRLDRRIELLAEGGRDGLHRDSVSERARAALPKVGAVLVPGKEAGRTRLQTRLIHAGLYGRQAMGVFLGVKLLLVVGPALAGAIIGTLGLVPFQTGLLVGCLAGTLGMIAPSFWLDLKKSARQANLRRAIPDALDVLVICLEGGTSLSAAIRRLAGELRTAHPMLADELVIVQREVQLGRSPGEALREFASRADLEEVRGLAAVILQSERFGASLVRALRVHAETLRSRRILAAEEMAQKSAVKLLFPTVFFIMPALFLAVLGPNAILIWEMFQAMGQ